MALQTTPRNVHQRPIAGAESEWPTATVAIASGTEHRTRPQDGSPCRCEVGTTTQICAHTRQYSALGALVPILQRCAPLLD
jgi:hypothetical protein